MCSGMYELCRTDSVALVQTIGVPLAVVLTGTLTHVDSTSSIIKDLHGKTRVKPWSWFRQLVAVPMGKYLLEDRGIVQAASQSLVAKAGDFVVVVLPTVVLAGKLAFGRIEEGEVSDFDQASTGANNDKPQWTLEDPRGLSLPLTPANLFLAFVARVEKMGNFAERIGRSPDFLGFQQTRLTVPPPPPPPPEQSTPSPPTKTTDG
eukprot:GABV01009467.1.p1 GENE.GABV01009467.1~~GABV01009467.1.p1  ORF type:complete len:220 (-),score=83.40 GABV01009467.1:19-633(-)